MAAVTVPFFTIWGGLTFTQTLFLQSWFMLWGFILEVPAGVVADIIGRKQSIIAGLIIIGIGLSVYGITPNFAIFMFAEFLVAFGLAFVSGADKALVYDTLQAIGEGENASKVFGRMKSIKTMGAVIGPVVGGVIARTIGLNWPVILEGIINIIAGLIALTLNEPIKEFKTNIKDYWKITKKGLKILFKNKVLRILAIDFVLTAVLFRFFFWFWQPGAAKSGIDIIYYGLIAAIFNGGAMILLTNTQKIERTLGIKRTILIVGIISGLAIIGMGLTNNWLLMILFITINFSLQSIREPIYQHYMNYFIDTKVRATTLSSIAMIRKLITAVLYPIVGLLMDWNLNNTLIIIGSMIVILTLTTRVSKELISK